MQYSKIQETSYEVTVTKNGKTLRVTFGEWDGVIDEIQEYVDERREDGWHFDGCKKQSVVVVTEQLEF